jgi:hypothetical protein
VLLSTGRAVAAGDDAGGGGEEADDASRWLGRWQWLGSPMTVAVFFFFFPVQRRRLLPFLQWCCNGGRR